MICMGGNWGYFFIVNCVLPLLLSFDDNLHLHMLKLSTCMACRSSS